MATNSILEAFDTALTSLTSLVANADAHSRSFMSTQLRQLAYRIESPQDTMYRIGHSVRCIRELRYFQKILTYFHAGPGAADGPSG